MATKDTLKVKGNSITGDELLSYIINVTPELQGKVDLPVQGDKNNIPRIGEIISSDNRYKNAFINTVNLIALTVIDRNGWDNPWDFTTQGTMAWGDSVRELMLDLVDPHDYNDDLEDEDKFIETEVPNVFNHIHILNYQKYYKTTTSDDQMSMAFESETGLFNFVDEVVRMLYESMIYDIFLVDKYMLCRRVLDGTVTSKKIDNYDNLTAREKATAIKTVSNLMTFRSPNYNPAGIRNAVSFRDQVAIIDASFEAEFSTETLATSFFKNDADFKINKLVLIDSFSEHDTQRLSKLLKDQYVAFTEAEITALESLHCVIMHREWYQDRNYALDNAQETGKETMFYNPQTLKANHFLHIWRCFATSPFYGACAMTSDTPGVTSVTVSPSAVSVSPGIPVQFSAEVVTTGFANKSVTWSVDDTSAEDGVEIDSTTGLLTIPSTASVESITVTATSVFDDTKTGTATVTLAGGETPGVTSVTVTSAGDVTTISAEDTIQMTATVVKTGNVSTSVEWSIDAEATSDGFTISSNGLLTAPQNITVESVTVTATSLYDTTKTGTLTLTVSS